jgi:hypothetical protein
MQGMTTIGTCTTDGSGRCCVCVSSTGTGTYTVSAAKTGYIGGNKTVSVTCGGTTTVNLTVTPDAGPYCELCFDGCNLLTLPDDCGQIAINDGNYPSTGGCFKIALPNGTYGFTVSCGERFGTCSGTVTITDCSCITTFSDCTTDANGKIQLPAASDYICAQCWSCVYPIKRILNFTDGCTGVTGTATWGVAGGLGMWYGGGVAFGFGPAPFHWAFGGAGGCAAQAGVAYWSQFGGSCGSAAPDEIVISVFAGCPKTDAPGVGDAPFNIGICETSVTCPTAFQVIYTIGAATACNFTFCPATTTIILSE